MTDTPDTPEMDQDSRHPHGPTVSIEEEMKSSDGYAKATSEAYNARAAEIYTEQAADVDIIITTALIPGRPAPKLLTAEDVAGMKSGQSELTLDCRTRVAAPMPNSVRPVIRMYLPPILSDIFPATGARTRAITDIGARISPALMAE